MRCSNAIALYLVTCAKFIAMPASAFVAAFVVNGNPSGTIQRSLSCSPSVGWTTNYRMLNSCQSADWRLSRLAMSAAVPDTAVEAYTFIGTELRGAAMKLHTKAQAPKEGEAPAPKSPVKPDWNPTHEDYLRFLVDSKAVYEALEDIVGEYPELSEFRNTGLERTDGLEIDIQWMMEEYGLQRPEVGLPGLNYASEVKRIVSESIPAFMDHYYNFYFAHTAGGRMIGKKISSLLLNKKVLEFYKWDGNVNKIKDEVKGSFEAMAAKWSRDEKDQCINETASAFRGGGALNGYIFSSAH